jgi:hypothetical protein
MPSSEPGGLTDCPRPPGAFPARRVRPRPASPTAFQVWFGPAPIHSITAAVLSEISDDWETERAYLNMEAR